MYNFTAIEIKRPSEELREMREYEKHLKSQPTQENIDETFEILRDFGIHIKKKDIPQKDTIGLLEKWRLQVIKDYIRS